MSLAIKWGSSTDPSVVSGFIYLSAVTSYTQDYRGQVTKHPVDSGASITDHFIKENPVFNISGVVSGTDISYIPFSVAYSTANQAGNTLIQPAEISVVEGSSSLLKYLPDTIGQFLSPSFPEVQMFGEDRTDLFIEELTKDQLKNLMEGIRYDSVKDKIVSDIKLVAIYEFDGINIRDIIPRLVITSFRIREDADTGDALFLDLTLEQVTFASLEKVGLPQDVQDSMKKKVSTKKKKTNAPSTPKDCATAQANGDTTSPSTPAGDLGLDKFGTN